MIENHIVRKNIRLLAFGILAMIFLLCVSQVEWTGGDLER